MRLASDLGTKESLLEVGAGWHTEGYRRPQLSLSFPRGLIAKSLISHWPESDRGVGELTW